MSCSAADSVCRLTPLKNNSCGGVGKENGSVPGCVFLDKKTYRLLVSKKPPTTHDRPPSPSLVSKNPSTTHDRPPSPSLVSKNPSTTHDRPPSPSLVSKNPSTTHDRPPSPSLVSKNPSATHDRRASVRLAGKCGRTALSRIRKRATLYVAFGSVSLSGACRRGRGCR